MGVTLTIPPQRGAAEGAEVRHVLCYQDFKNDIDLIQEQIVKLLKFSTFEIKAIGQDLKRSTRSSLLISEKFNIDVHAVVNYKCEVPERLQAAEKTEAEIFQGLMFVNDREGSEKDLQQLLEFLEKVHRLPVLGYTSGKRMDEVLDT